MGGGKDGGCLSCEIYEGNGGVPFPTAAVRGERVDSKGDTGVSLIMQ